jgi:hypothetical protein
MKRFHREEVGPGGEATAPSDSGDTTPPDNDAAPDESGGEGDGVSLDPKQQRGMDQLIEKSGPAD